MHRLRGSAGLLLLISLVSLTVAHGDPLGTRAAPEARPSAKLAVPVMFASHELVPHEAVVRLARRATRGRKLELGGTQVVPLLAIDDDTWLVRIEAAPEARAGATPAQATLDAINALGHDPSVLAAAPNVLIPFSAEPADPVFGAQRWSYDQIQLPDAWNHVTGSPNVRIALIDSGSTTHPDIVWASAFDPSDNDFNPINPNNYHHGTLVAGIIGATPNNGIGGAGICWGCRVLPVRSNGTSNGVDVGRAAAGLNWIAGYDTHAEEFTGPPAADIVNLSFNSSLYRCNHGTATFESFRNALARARQQGVFVVASAGNFEWSTGPAFPGDCDDVFAVAATDPWDALAGYSNHGLAIDLTAPGGGPNNEHTEYELFGEDVGVPSCTRLGSVSLDSYYEGTAGVVSTWSVSKRGPELLTETAPGISDFCYRYSSGTSYAAPHVSGVAGLLLAARPGMTPVQLEQVLRLTATPSSGIFGWGFFCPVSDGCGAGRLNASAAVNAIAGWPPLARVTPSSHDFGMVPFGTSSTLTIELGNVGWSSMGSTTPMTIEGDPWFSFAYGSGACMSGQSCNRAFSVPVHSTFQAPVKCTPTGLGERKARLIIPSTTAGGAISVPLRCTSNGAPVLSVPPFIEFGDVVPGAASDRTVPVTNTGTAPLTLSNAAVTGAAFSLISALPGPIAPGASASFTVRCLPSAAVRYSGTLTLSSNGGSASVGMSCRGFAPVLSVTPASLPFGDVPVNTATGRVVTLTNTGTAPLTVSNFSLSGGPFYPASPMPGTLAPGGSTTFEVRCQPPWISTYTGTLSFVSNGGNASVALSCRGYAAEISLQPFLPFGDVRVGVASDRPLTVTNLGTAPLTLSNATVSDAAFSIVGALPGPIAPGASANLTVRCLPSAAVSSSATLMLSSNGGSASAGLACRGVEPVLSVESLTLAFGDVRPGVPADLPLTVTNTGTASLTLSGATVGNAAFSIVGALPGPFAPGASANLTVRCLPSAAVSYSATLLLSSDGGSAAVALSCRGFAPVLSVSSTRLDFGTILVGTTSSRTLTVSNAGTAPLLVSSSTLTGPDFQLTTPSAFTVSPGTSQGVTVTCAPATVGSRTGTLTLQHNAGSPVSIALACNATAGQLQVVQPVGTMALASYGSGRATIRNIGTGPLRITRFSLLGTPNAGSLSMTGITLPVTVAPGYYLSWFVKCTPTAPNQYISARVYATHDGLPTGALFNVTCYAGVVIDDPVPPVPPAEPSAAAGVPSL